jgi:TrbC/VIRB2 pilin
MSFEAVDRPEQGAHGVRLNDRCAVGNCWGDQGAAQVSGGVSRSFGATHDGRDPAHEIIIIVTGLSLAFGDTSGGFRRLIQIVFGLSIAFAASSFFLSFFSFGGGVVIRWTRKFQASSHPCIVRLPNRF